jgi:hypothetical protein
MMPTNDPKHQESKDRGAKPAEPKPAETRPHAAEPEAARARPGKARRHHDEVKAELALAREKLQELDRKSQVDATLQEEFHRQHYRVAALEKELEKARDADVEGDDGG